MTLLGRLGMVVALLLAGASAPAAAQQRPPSKPVTPVVNTPVTAAPVASSVTSPHGSRLREPCASCHRADAWKPARISPTFRHAEKSFPLEGAHERAPCAGCHKALDFSSASPTCASCHTDRHQGEFGTACARCHTTRSFVDRGTAVRTHQATRFPLRGAHAIAACEACHVASGPGQPQFSGRSTTCESCHLATFRATRSPNHAAANFSRDCTSCHTISTWTGAAFDHATTKFPLTGRHAVTTCAGCHADNVFAGRSTTCVSCHRADYTAAKSPVHSQGFPTTCEGCHGTSQWQGAKFDHATTRFALTGGHRTVTCALCHADGVFQGKTMVCSGCHQAKFDATTNPAHGPARFASTCESCHTTSAWAPTPFDHSKFPFALTGAHATQSCAACHADRVFVGKPTTCVSCHQAKYDASTKPNHKASGFPTSCETCHNNTVAWTPASFDHQTTRFPLTGGHRTVTCAQCHADNVFRGKTMVCSGCHQGKFDATTNPAHGPAKFATTCESCHTTNGWTPTPFDHSKFPFALTGAHATQSCVACHADRVFVGKPTTCVSCHQAKYDATTSPNHKASGFPTTCETCHTNTVAWTGAFDHTTTRFPLTGGHRTVTCAQCHADNVFRGKTMVCSGCHQAKFDATTNPAHGPAKFANTCESCHTTTAWAPTPFDHSKFAFTLTGAHAAQTCNACHADRVFIGKPTTCVSCHQAKYDATTSPNHRTAGYPTTCQQCHGTASWQSGAFDHTTTRFPLTGGHRTVTCAQCHADNVFRGKTMVCSGCHQAKFDATTNPAHGPAKFANTCESCHTTTAWAPTPFDHSKFAFTLTGAHAAQTCNACHADRVFIGKPATCVSCHQAKYNATTTPNHRTSGFPTTCETCHNNTTSWTPATFNHQTTRFPLTGNHLAVSCNSCHADGVFRGKTMVCSGCHAAKFTATSKPNHTTVAFATTCESCHTTAGWVPSSWSHATTRFALTGVHLTQTCAACHADGVYRGKPMTCVSCHQAKYDATTNPNHRTSGFPTTCETCHGTASWQSGAFDHATTRFPLTGSHRTVTCAQCHADNVFRGKTMVCSGCHQAKFDATTNPAHGPARFANTCESCHTTTAWAPTPFDHSRFAFTLNGAHATQTCNACHADRVFIGKPTTCVSCHQAKFDATVNPNHRTSGFPTTCETCHNNTTSWTPASFNHQTTRFPLTGGHLAVSCNSCHGDGIYRGKTMVCSGCHQTKFNATTKPNHTTVAFATTCESCHTTAGWVPSSWSHSTTRFALAGAHLAVTCSGCHGDGVYRGKPMTCVSCHQAKFNATTNPNHVASGFPTTCETCHTVNAWVPSTFSHSTTRFPLTGLHVGVSCNSCHGDGIYRGKTMVCAGCHQAKFNATTKPNHTTVAFATTCESCHTTAGWVPSSWSHSTTRFALTGAHLTQTCAACHGDGVYRGKSMVCSTCHLAVYNSSTNPNHRTALFPTTCESCHTTTQWAGAVFNHDPSFPIYSGKHRNQWTSCAQCHTNNANYREFTCLTCHEHQQSTMDNAHRGRSGYRYDSALCYQCHPRGSAG